MAYAIVTVRKLSTACSGGQSIRGRCSRYATCSLSSSPVRRSGLTTLPGFQPPEAAPQYTNTAISTGVFASRTYHLETLCKAMVRVLRLVPRVVVYLRRPDPGDDHIVSARQPGYVLVTHERNTGIDPAL